MFINLPEPDESVPGDKVALCRTGKGLEFVSMYSDEMNTAILEMFGGTIIVKVLPNKGDEHGAT